MEHVVGVRQLTTVHRIEADVPALRGIDLLLDEGERAYRDHDLTGTRERALASYRRDHVGFDNLVPSATARENDHDPAQLSGGEQQRVAIARALAKRLDVLPCDEPTGALDVETGKLVLAVIGRVDRELGATRAVITHDAAMAAMAVLQLAGGRLVVRRNPARAAPETLVW